MRPEEYVSFRLVARENHRTLRKTPLMRVRVRRFPRNLRDFKGLVRQAARLAVSRLAEEHPWLKQAAEAGMLIISEATYRIRSEDFEVFSETYEVPFEEPQDPVPAPTPQL